MKGTIIINHIMNKLKSYFAFFAATSNIVAVGFFADAIIRQYSNPENVSSALGFWFAAFSLVLWIGYLLIFVLLAARKPKKK